MQENPETRQAPSEADRLLRDHWSAIRAREGGFEKIFGQLVDGIDQLAWMASGDGYIFWYNRRWYDYTGETLASMQGWGWRAVHHPEHIDRVFASVSIAWQRGVPFEMTFPLRGHDGVFRWFLTRVVPIFDERGQLVNWFGTNTDIDDQKRAQERLDALFAEAPVGIFVLEGEDSRVTLANEKARALLARGPEVLGLPFDEVVPPGSSVEVRRLLDGVRVLGRPAEGRDLALWVPAVAGGAWRRVHVDILAHPRQGAAALGGGVIVVIVDVSQRLAAERQTARLTDDLRKAVAVRDEFLAIGSHELKTPLTGLKLQLQLRRRRLARGGAAPEPAEAARLLESDEHQIDRLVVLVNDMLDIARIRSGRLTIQPRQVDLGRLVDDVLRRMAAAFHEAGSDLARAIEPGWVAVVDQARIEQVLTNLLANALKYAPGARVRVALHGDERAVRLVVADDGPGIAAEHQARIFGQFERAVGRCEVSGLGLGLYIVQQIVWAHDGEVSLASRTGEGACFTVTLPRVARRAAGAARRPGGAPGPEPH